MAVELAVAIGITGISAILAYTAMNLDKRHGMIQFLFLCLSVLFMIIDLYVIRDYVAVDNARVAAILDVGRFVMDVLFVFLLFYFLVSIVNNIYQKLTRSSRTEPEESL